MTIPDTLDDGVPVTAIAHHAFFWSGEETVTLGANIRSIGYMAFSYSETLQEMVLPESHEFIGHNAFECCNKLRRIHIPARLSDIELNCTFHCKGLEEISVDPANERYASRNGTLFNREMTVLLACPSKLEPEDGVYVVPEGVKAIAPGAFTLLRLLNPRFGGFVGKNISVVFFAHCWYNTLCFQTDGHWQEEIGVSRFGAVLRIKICAGMMKLVYMRDLGSRAVRRWGSSPHARTTPPRTLFAAAVFVSLIIRFDVPPLNRDICVYP